VWRRIFWSNLSGGTVAPEGQLQSEDEGAYVKPRLRAHKSSSASVPRRRGHARSPHESQLWAYLWQGHHNGSEFIDSACHIGFTVSAAQ
jgi:hypothetical protein